MKILHVGDTAGVACILAKYQRKLGHQAKVIGLKDCDPFGFLPFYKESALGNEWTNTVLMHGRDYDIIHIHGWSPLAPEFKKMGKRVVLHYHGSDLSSGFQGRDGDPSADLVLVSTPNLVKQHSRAQWLPNPIDTDIFNPLWGSGDGYLTFKMRYLDMNKLSLEFPYVVMDRDAHPIEFRKMPWLLSRFAGYIDIKYHKEFGLLEALSTTGLQALALGLQVLNWQKQWLQGLPEEHRPERVVDALMSKYYEMMQ